jgi:hypothetical protein
LGLFYIKPSRLASPSEEYKVRDPDMDFVDVLANSIKDNSYGDVAPMIANLELPDDYESLADEEKFEKAHRDPSIVFHTIGGNHSRLAFKQLARINDSFDKPRLVKVFYNLTRDEAIIIGVEHNRVNDLRYVLSLILHEVHGE